MKNLITLLVIAVLLTSCTDKPKSEQNEKTKNTSAFSEFQDELEKIDSIKIFIAKEIRTMDPSMPVAHAVAVANGKIVAVGEMSSLKPWMDNHPYQIDSTFIDKTLFPGFIDPHVHPSLPAVVTQFPFIAPDDWNLPTGFFPGAPTPEDYLNLLNQQLEAYINDENKDPKIPFITWGYHGLWHGELNRVKLNELFGATPVMLWHRSFHEMIGNDAAFKLLDVTDEFVAELQNKGLTEIDWENGHFWENGLMGLLPKMGFLLEPERYGTGMKNFFTMAHQNGITSVMDMGVGVFGDPVGETKLIREIAENNKVPARIVLTPIITDFIARGKTPEEALAEINEWKNGNSNRVRYENHFKIMIDGAIFSGASMFNDPGFIDGHEGLWMAPLETSYEFAELFWKEGYQIHAHTNGDKSTDALIAITRKLQKSSPRFDHRLSLEHFAYATETQAAQMKELGIIVSANPYYQYILSDIYAEKWLGPDRAKNMVPLAALKRNGIKFSLHSDCPMAPLSPLTLVWAAINRTTINDNLNNPLEQISLQDALEAITINAAWSMGWENKLGSIRAGKLADFAVLNENPFMVDPATIKDIEIWGVIYEGRKHPFKN